MKNPTQSIPCADVLRAVAIVLIFICHMPGYVYVSAIAEIGRGAATLGISLFVALSGYLLSRRYAGDSTITFRGFIAKRLARIIPMYLAAMGLYVWLFHHLRLCHPMPLDPLVLTIAIHALCVQCLVYPALPEFWTLWFVGMIVPFYIFFYFVRQKSAWVVIGNTIVLICAIYVVRRLFHVVDIRLILYLPLFVAGVLAARYQTQSWTQGRLVWVACISGMMTVTVYGLIKSQSIPELMDVYPGALVFGRIYLALLWEWFFAFSAVACVSSVALLVAERLPVELMKWIKWVALASFPAYLLHRPCFALVFSSAMINSWPLAWKVLAFGITGLTVLWISYCVEAWMPRHVCSTARITGT